MPCGLRQGKERPLGVDIENSVKVGFRDFCGRDADNFDASVGDNDVDAAKVLDRFSK